MDFSWIRSMRIKGLGEVAPRSKTLQFELGRPSLSLQSPYRRREGWPTWLSRIVARALARRYDRHAGYSYETVAQTSKFDLDLEFGLNQVSFEISIIFSVTCRWPNSVTPRSNVTRLESVVACGPSLHAGSIVPLHRWNGRCNTGDLISNLTTAGPL